MCGRLRLRPRITHRYELESGLAELTPAERAQRGKAARAAVPRESHAVFDPGPDRPDPIALLEEQAKARVPELVPIRRGRMMVSRTRRRRRLRAAHRRTPTCEIPAGPAQRHHDKEDPQAARCPGGRTDHRRSGSLARARSRRWRRPRSHRNPPANRSVLLGRNDPPQREGTRLRNPARGRSQPRSGIRGRPGLQPVPDLATKERQRLIHACVTRRTPRAWRGRWRLHPHPWDAAFQPAPGPGSGCADLGRSGSASGPGY